MNGNSPWPRQVEGPETVPIRRMNHLVWGDAMRFEYLGEPTEKSLAPLFSTRMRSVTFDTVLALSIVLLFLLMLLPKEGIAVFMREGESPMTSFYTFSAALVMMSYVSLRSGRGEMYPEEISYRLEKGELITYEEGYDFLSYGLVESLLHTMTLMMFLLPILVISASFSGTSLSAFLGASSILYSSSMLCRLFGFMTYLLFKKSALVGYLLARIFFILLMAGTSQLAPLASPILCTKGLLAGAETQVRFALGSYPLFMMVSAVAILCLTLVNQAILRARKVQEKVR